MLSSDEDIEFPGIIVTGVSEVYEDKIRSAVRTGFMAEGLRADGALVAIDGWGNHHVDFFNVIEQLGLKGIPSVGLSYIGTQGRLVCSNAFVDTIIDFNKYSSGYDSCVVGQNNLSETNAFKAAALLKSKIKKTRRPWTVESESSVSPRPLHRLTRRTLSVHEVRFGEQTFLKNGILTIRRGIEEGIAFSQPQINYLSDRRHHFYDMARPGKKKVILVKIVSGLGNMYDTSLFPREPGGSAAISDHARCATFRICLFLLPRTSVGTEQSIHCSEPISHLSISQQSLFPRNESYAHSKCEQDSSDRSYDHCNEIALLHYLISSFFSALAVSLSFLSASSLAFASSTVSPSFVRNSSTKESDIFVKPFTAPVSIFL